MLVNRPRRVICKVGNYDITVSSDNHLEELSKFDTFCDQFKGVIMAIVNSTKQPKEEVQS